MIIDKEQLIALLVDKTGLDEEQVEGQLSKLIERINQAAEEGKTFEIEGFGTFGMEDGVLEFTPADQLQTEVNNKYAGMKPIELIGAFKEPDEDEIPEIVEDAPEQSDQVWAFDEDAAEGTEDEVVEAGQEQSDDIEEVPEQETSSEEAQEEFEALINGDAVTESSEEAAEDDPEEESDRNEQEPVAVADEGSPVSETSEAKEEEQDIIGQVLVAVVIVIVVGFTGFLMYDFGVFESSEQAGPVSDSQPVEQSPPPVNNQNQENASEQSEISSEPDEQQEVTNPEESRESPNNQQPAYGLKGAVNTSLNNGYMIVVHSLRNQEQAKARKQDLTDRGYRALINEATVQGTAYYRVGIGQFATIEAAQDAISRIPEPYRSNNFIKRIK